MSIETMRQALEAWDAYNNASDSQEDAKAYASMVVAFGKLRTAIAEAEKQEPAPGYCKHCKQYTIEEPLPAAQWVGLTDEDAMQTWEGIIKYAPGEVRLKDFARAIEAKLKEKNT